MQGIMRIAMAVPHLHLGDVDANVRAHIELIQRAQELHAGLVVFPELSLTGATCGDLFFQQTLLRKVRQGIGLIAEACPEGMAAVFGAPVELADGLFNCAVVVSGNGIEGVVPKSCLSAAEKRWFRPAGEANRTPDGDPMTVPVGQPLTFASLDDVVLGVEIGSELFGPVPPSHALALSGADVIVNLSAMNELVARREYRRETVKQQSARLNCGYVYVSAGLGESTSDTVCSGHSLAASCGEIIRENEGYLADGYLLTVDLDVDRIRADRRSAADWHDAACGCTAERTPVCARLLLDDAVAPELAVSKQPFIPAGRAERIERCGQIFELQAAALAQRMKITGNKAVIGISGGLDSTLALLVACRAVDMLKLPRTNILGITMPCFGTTDHTYNNALELMRTLGVEQREIPIHESVRLHFRDIGHDESDHSVAYENAQARERTQILMDVANKFSGIVLGTGDLSEIALGWCTYNADHMSMYGVNCGVPKTLVRWVVKTAAESPEFAQSHDVLVSILDTPISPELLPPDEDGNIAQQTEDLVGPYALHDFFLYYVVRYGFEPQKIYDLACMAFKDDFDRATILKWLKNFYRRFFTQQFKRNCSPDGVKVGSVGLSPRGDWQMPADATSRIWMQACESLEA